MSASPQTRKAVHVQIDIDFSLFASPVKCYGVVTGIIYIEGAPAEGDKVELSRPGTSLILPKVLENMRIEAVLPCMNDGSPTAVALNPVVAETYEEAASIALFVEERLGLSCDRFEQLD